MSLAIVIPAYKSEFLDETLTSIAAQTNKNFRLYIGDDNSPYHLYNIISRFESILDITYVKFPDNLGGKNLVKQWQRCIDMVGNEQWLWLFSDDDFMENTCVEAFYNELDITSQRFDVYRFNTRTINEHNEVLFTNPVFSNPETAEGFLVKKLTRKIDSYVTEYIFSATAYKELGGFVDFPLAWASDDATWVKLSFNTGIWTVRSSYVHWRLSAYNISNTASSNGEIKALALLKFAEWGLATFNATSESDLARKFEAFIFGQLGYYNIKLTYIFISEFANRIKKILGVPYKKTFIFFINKMFIKNDRKLTIYLTKIKHKLALIK
jgi:glycosyltransferase involved in cell wall biosynthesis